MEYEIIEDMSVIVEEKLDTLERVLECSHCRDISPVEYTHCRNCEKPLPTPTYVRFKEA